MNYKWYNVTIEIKYPKDFNDEATRITHEARHNLFYNICNLDMNTEIVQCNQFLF